MYRNHDPVMTLAYFTGRPTKFALIGKTGKMSCESKTCRKLANGTKIYDSDKIWTNEVSLPRLWVYKTIIFKRILEVRSQVSVYKTIWSSGLSHLMTGFGCIANFYSSVISVLPAAESRLLPLD